ncbi:uncharacterized protein HMPREF1541_09450 [Cyphellophora europaea CBS 101466]|uniref:Rhodopsin domain-containing protein n=1 Tax=Cyphellophora europaea (strain CBS 101466) TaxID=1220924 RepID=W2SC69_CYPE1|nr:uncharacterized protein HMPREF1541_09450 [Cyphellophora europaea CBS 101466]ETN45618.1 hypothetical protein HMPREF1541_09450 [Cyphellophora europaea CBS 101466]
MVNALRPPPEVVASWPKPNFVNSETHGPGLMVVASMLPSIAVGVVATRLYARIYITRAFGIDDVLIVAGLVFGIALSCLVMVGNQVYYNGYHIWDTPPASAVPHRLNVWIAQVCYTLSLSCVKISVLLFYRRLSVSFTRGFLIAVWIGIAYNIVYVVGFIMALCLLCRPLDAYWKSFNLEYYATANFTCGSEQIAEPLSAIFSVIGDAYSTILPLVLVSRLSLPSRQKWALYFLFSLGFSVVICGAVRSYYMYRVVNVDYDFTWTLWKIWVWGEFELWLAVYAASAPALKPFFKRYVDRLSTSSASRHGPNQVYLVRGDAHGGLGRVERIWVTKKRKPDAYLELSSDQKTKRDELAKKDNHIMKSVEYDVEPYDVEALPPLSTNAGPSTAKNRMGRNR